MESFDSGLIAIDRRDLTQDATPTDSLCSPFNIGDTDDSFGVHSPTVIGDVIYEALGPTTVAFTPRPAAGSTR